MRARTIPSHAHHTHNKRRNATITEGAHLRYVQEDRYRSAHLLFVVSRAGTTTEKSAARTLPLQPRASSVAGAFSGATPWRRRQFCCTPGGDAGDADPPVPCRECVITFRPLLQCRVAARCCRPMQPDRRHGPTPRPDGPPATCHCRPGVLHTTTPDVATPRGRLLARYGASWRAVRCCVPPATTRPPARQHGHTIMRNFEANFEKSVSLHTTRAPPRCTTKVQQHGGLG